MSFRTKSAELFRQVTPQGPLYGLPLPEGLNIEWPDKVRQAIRSGGEWTNWVSKAHFGYYKVKDKVFYMIRGL